MRVQDEFHGHSPDWRRHYEHAHSSPGVTARMRDGPPSGKGSPDPLPPRPEGREWVGNPVSGISPGRKVPKDNVNIAEPGRQSFFEHMAQQPNTDRATDAYEGRARKQQEARRHQHRFTHDPSSRVPRSRWPRGSTSSGRTSWRARARRTPWRAITRGTPGDDSETTTAQSGQSWSPRSGVLDRGDPAPPPAGARKGQEPVGRSGRQGMFAAGARSGQVDAGGTCGRHAPRGSAVKGGVDAQVGKGSLLLPKNGLGGGGRMIDDDDDY